MLYTHGLQQDRTPGLFWFYQLAAVDAVVTEHMLSAEKRAEIEK
jgi:hypothetical protein